MVLSSYGSSFGYREVWQLHDATEASLTFSLMCMGVFAGPVLFPVLSTPRFTVLVSHACLTHPLPATSNVAHIGRDDGKPPGAKHGKQYTRPERLQRMCVRLPSLVCRTGGVQENAGFLGTLRLPRNLDDFVLCG